VQRSERELAAADSRFFQLGGIQLHYKRRSPAYSALTPPPRPPLDPTSNGGSAAAAQQRPGSPAALVHCLHGFGASAYSWSFVQQGLADALHAVVTAHDMPGFGLTQR
jgi:pimeloyl-ACP methyl ester carboxylesterase